MPHDRRPKPREIRRQGGRIYIRKGMVWYDLASYAARFGPIEVPGRRKALRLVRPKGE